MFPSRQFLIVVWVSLFLLGGGQFVSAADEKRTPTDVFQELKQLRTHLQTIRLRIGLAKNKQPIIAVQNVSPREVFDQAVTLQKKVYQLLSEQGLGNENERTIIVPKGSVTPSHIFSVVEDANERLKNLIKKQVVPQNKVQRQTGAKTPTDVFQSIIQANRQLNLMLKRKVVPSDVYQRVQSSIYLTQALREKFSLVSLLPEEPLQPGKTPKDVYMRLIKCFKIQREVLRLSNIKVMDFSESMVVDETTTPGDVYDMASVVFSEVRVAYLTLKNRPLTPGVFYPGQKKPAHVYQLVGVLEATLNELLAEVKK